MNEGERTRIGEPQQHQITESAVVYRVSTSQGTVYFKVVQEGSTEVAHTHCIAQLFPDTSPTLVGDAGDLTALVSADFGPAVYHLCFAPEGGKPGYEDKERVASLILQQWAQMQQSSIPHIELLMSAGVPVYDAAWIRKSFEGVLSFLDQHKSIASELAVRMRSCHTHVDRTLDLWSTTQVPMTIVHGDLHERNIAQPKGPGSDFVFFDWDSVFIGHPFLDLLGPVTHPLFKHESAYLECWTKYADLQSINEIATWTKPLQYLVSAAFELRSTLLIADTRDVLVEIYSTEFCEAVESIA